MEKEIEPIINSFLYDLDQRKLEVLDRLLFSLLFKKEMILLKGKADKETARIEKILHRYHDYRSLILRRSIKNSDLKKEFLIDKIFQAPTRLILLITHSCQLKCRYCKVRKFSSSINEKVMLKAIDLLFTSKRNDLQLQFFGGEPLLRFDLLQKAVEYADRINKKEKRDLTFILTTNGIALTKEKVDFLKRYKFLVEFSIDGEVENQLKMRTSKNHGNYYSQLIDNLKLFFKSKIPHYSISVMMPQNVRMASEVFTDLVNLGFTKLQINYALGVFWPEKKETELFRETAKIVSIVKKKKGIEFINLTSIRREPVVLNSELTVDCDGGIYLESGICLEEDFMAMKKKFLVTDIKKAHDINLLASTQFQNFYRLSKVYADADPKFRKIILNNILLGRKYNELIKKWISH